MSTKTKWKRAEQRNNEHSLVYGKEYVFTDSKGNTERGKLLYLFTRRIYKHDDDGNIDPNSWKVIHFRCGYTPVPARPPVCSIHLELGWFTIADIE